MRYATCHPDRKHRARGLCTSCYTALWAKSNGYMYQIIWNHKHPEVMREIKKRYRNRNRGKLNRKLFPWRYRKREILGGIG